MLLVLDARVPHRNAIAFPGHASRRSFISISFFLSSRGSFFHLLLYLFSQARAFPWWKTKLVLSSLLVGFLMSSIPREKKPWERCVVRMFVEPHENDLIVCRAPHASSCSWLRQVEHEDAHVRASSDAVARSEDEAETSGRRRTHACETKEGDVTWDRQRESQLLRISSICRDERETRPMGHVDGKDGGSLRWMLCHHANATDRKTHMDAATRCTGRNEGTVRPGCGLQPCGKRHLDASLFQERRSGSSARASLRNVLRIHTARSNCCGWTSGSLDGHVGWNLRPRGHRNSSVAHPQKPRRVPMEVVGSRIGTRWMPQPGTSVGCCCPHGRVVDRHCINRGLDSGTGVGRYPVH